MSKKTSQSAERRMRLEEAKQKKLQQEKKQMKIVIIVTAALVAIIVGACLLIPLLSKNTDDIPEVVYDLAKADSYTVSQTATNYVKLNVSYTADDGTRHNGDIIVKLDPTNAPITVANFQKLVGEGFYDGLIFHRVIEGFMIQGGDPKGNGTGGSDEDIKGEFSANDVNNTIKHERGVISMARSEDYNSASSQFFIVHETSPHLDGQYAAFGHVVFGMKSVDGIATVSTNSNNKPLREAKIESAVFVNYTEHGK